MNSTINYKLANFLFKKAFPLYKWLYWRFKNKQDFFEIHLIKENINSGDMVLDIGANIGFYSGIIAELIGEKGKVYCFEPVLVNYNHLKSETHKYSNVIVFNKAVAANTGPLKIYTSKILNVDHRMYEFDGYDSIIEIESVKLDEYFYDCPRIDFIKIDIQGFEMEALKGMQRIINANENLKLISEFWPYGLKKAGSSAIEYYNFLVQNGFEIWLIKKRQLSKISLEEVSELNSLDEKHYFNIFAIK
jgi:FkbM family methyltransferase